jgi:type I restriction enzyme S subunit
VGDVFFTREAPMGEACLVPELQNLCMGQRMMYMRPDLSELDPEFLLHSIYGPLVRAHIQHVSNGSTVGHLRLGQVGAIPLLWCPIEEQREIVVRIRVESAPLDEAVARIEREVSLMQEYRTRLTADIVAGKLDVRAAAASLPEFVDEPADEAVIDEITDELAYEDAE